MASVKESHSAEMNRRANVAWGAFGRLGMFFKGKLPLCLKRKVFDQCVPPVLTGARETSIQRVKAFSRLHFARRGLEKSMLATTRRDWTCDESIRSQPDGFHVIRRLSCYGGSEFDTLPNELATE